VRGSFFNNDFGGGSNMNTKRFATNNWQKSGVLFAIFILTAILLSSCASAPRPTFNDADAAAQMIVEPPCVRMGVANFLTGTDLHFRGKGFEPEDSVFIKIMGVEKDGKAIDIPIADSEVDAEGNFDAEVQKLVKITEFIRAGVTLNDDMETVVVLKEDPMASGTYQVVAESMESDKTAESQIVVSRPSYLDKTKDLLGRMLGKIIKEKNVVAEE
jgi:hypothetical protein